MWSVNKRTVVLRIGLCLVGLLWGSVFFVIGEWGPVFDEIFHGFALRVSDLGPILQFFLQLMMDGGPLLSLVLAFLSVGFTLAGVLVLKGRRHAWLGSAVRICSMLIGLLYVIVFFGIGECSPVFAGIYQDFNAHLPWMKSMMSWLTLPLMLPTGLALASFVVLKDRKYAWFEGAKINAVALVLLLMLAVFWIWAALVPIFRMHELVS